MKKRLCIAGYTGFIGRHIVPMFEESGFEVVGIEKKDIIEGNLDRIVRVVDGSDAVINLAGVSINRRWSKKNKELIRSSRTISTALIVSAVEISKKRPDVFVNASGVDIYPQSRICYENCTERNDSFLSDVISEWENTADQMNKLGIRTVKTRFGVVLGKGGGVFKIFNENTRKFVGVVFGSGKQHMPVVHIYDVFSAMKFIIKNETLYGAVNVVAPFDCRQIDIVEKISEKYGKKFKISINKWIVKSFAGEMSCLLLDDRIVYPKKLIESGFKFKFDNINAIIEDLIYQ